MTPHLSRGDLEQLSLPYVRRYLKHATLYIGERCSCILPEEMLKIISGLRMYQLPLSPDGSILGATAVEDTVLTLKSRNGEETPVRLQAGDILIDSGLRTRYGSGCRNFTILHEAAHQILYRTFPGAMSGLRLRTFVEYRSASDFRGPIDWNEWQADTLASFLLMPDCVVRNAMREVEWNPARTHVDSSSYFTFCSLANLLGVSQKALELRLRRMQLIDFVEYPKRYIL